MGFKRSALYLGLICGLVAIVVVAWQSGSPAPKPEAQGASDRVKREIEIAAPVAVRPISLADKFDLMNSAPDVWGAARAALANGTADEKGWAADLLHQCLAFAALNSPLVPERSLVPEQVAAKHAIETRCATANSISAEERRSMMSELRGAAAASTSDYAMLHAVLHDHDSNGALRGKMFGDGELALVQRAFYGDDPLLRRDAYWAIESVLLGTSQARFDAFASAADSPGPQGDLEQDMRCLQTESLCHDSHVLNSDDLAPATQALRARYRDAMAEKMPLHSLLSLE